MAKILVIEDNELNLKLMKDILCAQGYEVDFACDGQDGLDKAQNNEYDLILLDIQMPVVSGYDFLKTYQKQTNSGKRGSSKGQLSGTYRRSHTCHHSGCCRNDH